jgi:hypothetical protein
VETVEGIDGVWREHVPGGAWASNPGISLQLNALQDAFGGFTTRPDGRLNDPDGVLWRLTSISSLLPPTLVHGAADAQGDEGADAQDDAMRADEDAPSLGAKFEEATHVDADPYSEDRTEAVAAKGSAPAAAAEGSAPVAPAVGTAEDGADGAAAPSRAAAPTTADGASAALVEAEAPGDEAKAPATCRPGADADEQRACVASALIPPSTPSASSLPPSASSLLPSASSLLSVGMEVLVQRCAPPLLPTPVGTPRPD